VFFTSEASLVEYMTIGPDHRPSRYTQVCSYDELSLPVSTHGPPLAHESEVAVDT